MHSASITILSSCWNCCHVISNCSLIAACVCGLNGWFAIKPNQLTFYVISIYTNGCILQSTQADRAGTLYNTINHVQNTYKRQSIASPWWCVMEYLLWAHSQICIPRIQYLAGQYNAIVLLWVYKCPCQASFYLKLIYLLLYNDPISLPSIVPGL